MHTRLRLAAACLLLLAVCATTARADRKDFDELVRDATQSSPEAYRLANARALVAAYLFTGDTLAQIEQTLSQFRSAGHFTQEFSQALEEAKAGQATDVCIEAQDPPAEPVQGVNLAAATDAELDRLILTGSTSALKRAASKEILRRLLNRIALGTEYVADGVFKGLVYDIAKPFDSLYDVRVYGLPGDRSHEEKVFDELKIDLIRYNHGGLAIPFQTDEMIEESGTVLAQVYYAEFLVYYAESRLNRNYAALSAQIVCGDPEA